MTPSISVVIPCYNAAKYLGEAVDSVLRQTCQPLEILVIDDGSTDGSGTLAESYGPPVRVIRQANQGQSAARNRGICEARGEWLALLDADDLWEPEKLRLQLDALKHAGSELGCVYSHYYVLQDGKRRDLPQPQPYDLTDRSFVSMLTHPFIHPSSAIVRTDLARRHPFDVRYKQHEDILFFVRLRAHSMFHCVPTPLVAYRLPRPGAGQNLTASHLYWIEGAWTRYCFAKEHPNLFSESDIHYVRQLMLEVLVSRHDSCYMAGDFSACQRAYELAVKIAGTHFQVPTRMRRPRWLAGYYRLRRRIGALIRGIAL